MKPKGKVNKRRRRNRKMSGFTLVELLIVIAIIGLLASIILVSVQAARSSTRDTSRYDSIKTVRTALELYYYDNGHYPIYGSPNTAYPLDDALTGSTPPVVGPYLNTAPIDPVNAGAYIYQYVYGSNKFPADSYGLYIPYEKFAACKFRTPMYPINSIWFGVKDCGDINKGTIQY